MRNRPNVLTLTAPMIAAAGCIAMASPAFAQQTRPGEVMGMRYLSWSGKVAGPADGLRRSTALTSGPTPAPAPVTVSADNSRYPGVQTVSRPSRYGAGANSLTPASVWTGADRTSTPLAQAPQPVSAASEMAASASPVSQQDPAAQAQAQAAYQAQVQADYQAWYQAEAQAQYQAQVQAMPQPQPKAVRVAATEQQSPSQQFQQQPQQTLQQRQAEVQTQSKTQPEPEPQQRADAGLPPGYDPMAPRRDAPIFRMQQPQTEAVSQTSQAQPAPTAQAEIQEPVLTQPTAGRTYSGQAYAGAEPPRESARYYSVHRGEGRQPDPIAMPVSVYLDNAPIDLAEPPAAPVPGRTVNGRTQVIVPNQDPSLP